MSSREYMYIGYGFQIENAKNLELIKNILKLTYCDKKEIIDYINNSKVTTVSEFINDIEYQFTAQESVSFAIADWMTSNKELNPRGITFEGYESDKDMGTKETVMFSPNFPWSMNEEEKSLTLEDLYDILLRFAYLLQINKNEINYQEVRYFG